MLTINTVVGKFGLKDKVVPIPTLVLEIPLILFEMLDPLAVST